jgi:hypothetical protein
MSPRASWPRPSSRSAGRNRRPVRVARRPEVDRWPASSRWPTRCGASDGGSATLRMCGALAVVPGAPRQCRTGDLAVVVRWSWPSRNPARIIGLVRGRATRCLFGSAESESLVRSVLPSRLAEAGLLCRTDDRGGQPVVQLVRPLVCGPDRFDHIESMLRAALGESVRQCSLYSPLSAADRARSRSVRDNDRRTPQAGVRLGVSCI